jgi:hypothetical protein
LANRVSSLNHFIDAIILWNTVDIRRAVRFVHDQETPNILAEVAPLP